MPTTKPNLKDYKGETFGIDPETIKRAMVAAKHSSVAWVLLSGESDIKRKVDELIDGNWEWYNWDMSLRDKPRSVSDGESMEELESYDNNEPSPVVAKNATTEPQRTRAVDRLKGRRR